MAAQEPRLKFLGVGRRSDNAVVATYTHHPDPLSNFEERTASVLSRGQWDRMTTNRLSLEDGSNILFVTLDDEGRVYFAFASSDYPARLVFGSPDAPNKGLLPGSFTKLTQKPPSTKRTVSPLHALFGQTKHS